MNQTEWARLRKEIMRRDHRKCQAACGCTERLTVHHIIPRSEGGKDDESNLITLCAFCHDEIEDTDIRTLAMIRVYAPHWHESAGWYNTKPQRVTQARMKQPMRIKYKKPKAVLSSSVSKRKQQPPVANRPQHARSYQAPEMPMPARKVYESPNGEIIDGGLVRRKIMYKLLEIDEYFDPAELRQTPEAWQALLLWWITDKPLSAAQYFHVVGLDWDSPIYEADIAMEEAHVAEISSEDFEFHSQHMLFGETWNSYIKRMSLDGLLKLDQRERISQ